MKTMGLSSLHLVAPERFPDPEAEWRAMRATDVLGAARVHATLEEALRGTAFAAACSARTRGLAVPEVAVREAAARMVQAAGAQPVAVVFGNETNGLTNEHVNTCSLVASIPTNPDYSSLNLAAAVQVVAYELRMAAQAGVDGADGFGADAVEGGAAVEAERRPGKDHVGQTLRKLVQGADQVGARQQA